MLGARSQYVWRKPRSALFTPVVCSSVLDNLCNYFSADWRDGMNSGFHRYPYWGMSTVEDLVTALRLWHDIAACSSTCRAWHAALKPFANPNDLCRRALRLTLLAPATSGLRSSSVRDAVDLVAMFAQIWWHGRCIVDMPSFQLRAWPVLVSSVELQSELREEEDDDLFDGPVGTLLNHHAPQMMDFAKKILPLPLAWKTIPRTLGVHSMSAQRFAICELTESDSTKDQSSAAAVQVDEEGNIQLLALDGARLLPIADETLSSVMGLQYVASTSGLHTRRVRPVPAGAPCGTPYCSRDERDLGAHIPLREDAVRDVRTNRPQRILVVLLWRPCTGWYQCPLAQLLWRGLKNLVGQLVVSIE